MKRPRAPLSRDVVYAVTALTALAVMILIGGATRANDFQRHVLTVGGGLLLLWATFDPRLRLLDRRGRQAVSIVALIIGVALLQLVPLPPGLWGLAPGRDIQSDGYRILFGDYPWAALSLSPVATWETALRWAPALALFLLAAKAPGEQHLRWAPQMLVLLGAASTFLGIVQVLDGVDSQFYLYPATRSGAVGFFVNPNHQAAFLLMTLPFGAALVGQERHRRHRGGASWERAGLWVALSIINFVGVLAAASVAGFILAAPVLLASFVIAFSKRSQGTSLSRASWLFSGAFIVVAILMSASPYVIAGASSFWPSLAQDVEASMGRPMLFATTWRAVVEFFPVGAGMGSFEIVFPSFEDPAQVGHLFANHAHNEYLEVLMENGLFGLLLLALVLGFTGRLVIRAWSAAPSTDSRLAKAAAVAIGVVALHSLVDFPLRTDAIAGVTALCFAYLVREFTESWGRKRPSGDEDGKHITL